MELQETFKSSSSHSNGAGTKQRVSLVELQSGSLLNPVLNSVDKFNRKTIFMPRDHWVHTIFEQIEPDKRSMLGLINLPHRYCFGKIRLSRTRGLKSTCFTSQFEPKRSVHLTMALMCSIHFVGILRFFSGER